ncbi:hypothetical protein SY89_02137 [Halolamina pelagica]|uniref:Uncharacterized protein n=1 Tax=Halolamina pelagica TaxID=699431 RepID=A0A0P7HCV6_9EURY|nr:hypothetical protein SY89_02137 [Halolamina pelagica]
MGKEKTVGLSEDTHSALSHMKIDRGFRSFEELLTSEIDELANYKEE